MYMSHIYIYVKHNACFYTHMLEIVREYTYTNVLPNSKMKSPTKEISFDGCLHNIAVERCSSKLTNVSVSADTASEASSRFPHSSISRPCGAPSGAGTIYMMAPLFIFLLLWAPG